MRFVRPDEVKELRKRYPAGTRVELLQMEDIQAPPIGTRGTVWAVDDAGSLMVHWDNGSGLAVVFGVDRVRIVDNEPEEQKTQDGGKCHERIC